MIEDEDEGFLVVDKGLKTKGDKARAAAHIGRMARDRGVSHDEASRSAVHELKHALADEGEGQMGLVTKRKGRAVSGAFYATEGERSHGQRLKIQIAPGDDMSDSDKKRAARSALGVIAGWFGIKIK